MGDIVISALNLAKRYDLHAAQAFGGGGSLLREKLEALIVAPFSRRQPTTSDRPARNGREFWALRDVSFDIRQGEVVGLVGGNGAGKSTLLKILSRVVAPTSGEARIRGRVGSLLEVGAGFHPELTGHENIYLNGSLIGMRRREIEQKYDEIVAFSGIERFLHTPVKYYSSGMFVRLAFSIAATLETDVLFLDEVLTVGDAEFQNKSRQKIREILKSGRTIILVSHDINAIRMFCTRGLWLRQGTLVEDGPVEHAVKDYVDSANLQMQIPLGEVTWSEGAAPANHIVGLRAARVVHRGSVASRIPSDEEFFIEIEYDLRAPAKVNVSASVHDETGYALFSSVNYRGACLDQDEASHRERGPGIWVSRCTIPANLLNVGEFSLYVNVIHGMVAAAEANQCVRFMVTDGPTMREEYQGYWPYPLRPRLAWSTARKP